MEDDGAIVGTTRSRLEEWVMTACRDKIRPEIIPYFEAIRDVEPGKDVAVVQVDRGWTVHHVWHNNHRTYYIRVGSQSREASAEELQRLFQQRGAFRSELRPVSGSSISDLDLRRLRDYFVRVRGQDVPHHEDTAGWRQLLVNTEFLTDEGDTVPATIASLLLFCRNPNRFLPQAGISAVAYPGREEIYGQRACNSPRADDPLFSEDGLIENGLVEQAVEFVRRNTRVQALLQDGSRREDQWAYPQEAIREALVNAIVHRDYLLSSTDIELSIYQDRIEIASPGRLPNGITPERMIVGCRAARNQLLKDVMRDYGYLEHMGMGVPRKIVKEMRERNGTMPEFIEDTESLTVRLWCGRFCEGHLELTEGTAF